MDVSLDSIRTYSSAKKQLHQSFPLVWSTIAQSRFVYDRNKLCVAQSTDLVDLFFENWHWKAKTNTCWINSTGLFVKVFVASEFRSVVFVVLKSRQPDILVKEIMLVYNANIKLCSTLQFNWQMFQAKDTRNKMVCLKSDCEIVSMRIHASLKSLSLDQQKGLATNFVIILVIPSMMFFVSQMLRTKCSQANTDSLWCRYW